MLPWLFLLISLPLTILYQSLLAVILAKQLAQDANLTPAQSASLLDIFACINQGLIPYGAQALLLGATMKISPIEVVSYAFYPMVLMVVAVLSFNKMIKVKPATTETVAHNA